MEMTDKQFFEYIHTMYIHSILHRVRYIQKKFDRADEITPLDVDAAVDKALRKQNKEDGFAELDALEKELTRIACFLGE